MFTNVTQVSCISKRSYFYNFCIVGYYFPLSYTSITCSSSRLAIFTHPPHICG